VEELSIGQSSNGTLSVDRGAVDDADLREADVRLLAGDPLSQALLDGLHIGKLEYDGLSVRSKNGTVQPIGNFALSHLRFRRAFGICGAELERGACRRQPDPIPQVKEAFDKIQLDSATLSLAVAFDWNIARKRLTIHDTMLKIDELGTLALTADFLDAGPGFAPQDRARLAHLKLRYDDVSLGDRGLKAMAAQTGADPELLRRRLLGVPQIRSPPSALPHRRWRWRRR